VAASSAGWLATVLAVPALALAGHRDLAELALAGETAAYLMSAECVPDEAPPLSVDETGAISGSVPRVLSGGTAVRFTAEGARTADSALTVHGAIGYTWEYDLQLFYKRARLDEKLLGTPAQWNERIAAGLALV
jgi:alkylation response protein AidB-like acyl-CoA dehydrogenase